MVRPLLVTIVVACVLGGGLVFFLWPVFFPPPEDHIVLSHACENPSSSESCPASLASKPASDGSFAAMLNEWSRCNSTLRKYFMSTDVVADLYKNWVPLWNCEVSRNCWCGHVSGDLDKEMNPDGWKHCEINASKKGVIKDCPEKKRDQCTCYTGRGKPCLFGHMSPGKLLYVIALARAVGATHIIEEGREGGLSAFVYNMHALRVTSVEYLPLTSPAQALRQLAPEITQLTGDGSVLIPSIVGNLSDAAAARTIVMFDGEKRWAAYKTYKRIKGRVVAAIFDDAFPDFVNMLRKKEAAVFYTGDDRCFKGMKDEMSKQLPFFEKVFGNWVHQYSKAHFNNAEFAMVPAMGWRTQI